MQKRLITVLLLALFSLQGCMMFHDGYGRHGGGYEGRRGGDHDGGRGGEHREGGRGGDHDRRR